MPSRLTVASVALLLVAMTACTPSPSATTTPSESAQESVVASVAPTITAQPTLPSSPDFAATYPLPVPTLRSTIQVRTTVTPSVPREGKGQMVVTVTNLSQYLIPDVVLRWNTDLKQRLWLAPFSPSSGRVCAFCVLRVNWTRWVEGPGELGEPAGTTSLGWGPLLPRATLTIRVVATRVVAGPVGFDLQFLSRGSILHFADNSVAQVRIFIP